MSDRLRKPLSWNNKASTSRIHSKESIYKKTPSGIRLSRETKLKNANDSKRFQRAESPVNKHKECIKHEFTPTYARASPERPIRIASDSITIKKMGSSADTIIDVVSMVLKRRVMLFSIGIAIIDIISYTAFQKGNTRTLLQQLFTQTIIFCLLYGIIENYERTVPDIYHLIKVKKGILTRSIAIGLLSSNYFKNSSDGLISKDLIIYLQVLVGFFFFKSATIDQNLLTLKHGEVTGILSSALNAIIGGIKYLPLAFIILAVMVSNLFFIERAHSSNNLQSSVSILRLITDQIYSVIIGYMFLLIKLLFLKNILSLRIPRLSSHAMDGYPMCFTLAYLKQNGDTEEFLPGAIEFHAFEELSYSKEPIELISRGTPNRVLWCRFIYFGIKVMKETRLAIFQYLEGIPGNGYSSMLSKESEGEGQYDIYFCRTSGQKMVSMTYSNLKRIENFSRILILLIEHAKKSSNLNVLSPLLAPVCREMEILKSQLINLNFNVFSEEKQRSKFSSSDTIIEGYKQTQRLLRTILSVTSERYSLN